MLVSSRKLRKDNSSLRLKKDLRLCRQHVENMWTGHPQIQHVQSCTGWSHFFTRTRVAPELEGSGLHIFHPRVMSRSLPHLTLTTSTSSLSLSSPIFPTVSPTHTRSLVHDPYLPCEVPRQSAGSTQIPALTGYEPNTIETNSIGTEAIESEGLEPRRIELDRKHGTDPCQIQERLMRRSLAEDVAEYGKVGVVYVRSKGLWIISNTNCTGETCCNVFIREQGIGKPIQEFYLQTRWSVKSG